MANDSTDSPRGITLATLSDVDAIVALAQSAYRGEGSKKGWTTEAHLLDGQRTDPESVAALITPADSVMLIMREDSGTLIACCNVALSSSNAQSAYFGLFAISPTCQNAGLGKKMMAAAEEYARKTFGAKAMEMTVIAQRHELIAWYLRRGYILTGERQPFPAYDDERFGLPKRPDLEFVCLVKSLEATATTSAASTGT